MELCWGGDTYKSLIRKVGEGGCDARKQNGGDETPLHGAGGGRGRRGW